MSGVLGYSSSFANAVPTRVCVCVCVGGGGGGGGHMYVVTFVCVDICMYVCKAGFPYGLMWAAAQGPQD